MSTESWHIVRFQGSTFTTVAEEVDTFHEGNDGTLWVKTADDKLYRRSSEGRMQRVDGVDGTIGDLAVGRRSRVWIGTGTGLYRWANGRLTEFSVREGPPSINVLKVEPDVEGDCLVSASEGIFRRRRRAGHP